MRITIFGATGTVGKYLVDTALERGHEVVAVTRDRSRIDVMRPSLTVAEAQLDRDEDIESSLVGADAVLVSLADAVADTGTAAIIRAMQHRGVERVEVLTGFGTSAISRRQLDAAMRASVAAIRLIMYRGFVIKERQDAAVRSSGLTYTIVQPPSLTFGRKLGTYQFGDYKAKSIFGSLTRADLADFMLDNLELERFLNESVFVQA